jgi:hypothetical protein
MWKLLLLAMFFLPAAGPASATEPGTPMDCSDLLLAPGLTCSEFSEPGEGGFRGNTLAVLDNDGRILTGGDGSIHDVIVELAPCGQRTPVELGLVFLVVEGALRTPLVSVRERCLDPATTRIEGARSGPLLFDAPRGALLLGMSSNCSDRSFGECEPGYGGRAWIARIDGFTPLADVLPAAPPPLPLCSNGLDDDGDGEIDAADRHCKSDADNDESRP